MSSTEPRREPSGPVVTVTDALLRFAPRLTVRLYASRERRRGEPSLVALDRYVRRCDVVLDIGAHRGVYTQRLAQLVGPAGHVHAFEPNPISLRILDSIRAGRSNIDIHPFALSDATGTTRLRRPIVGGRRIDAMSSVSRSAQRDAASHDSVPIRLERLDDVLASEQRPIAFLKCDVEGHEHEVFLGAWETLRRHRPVILVEIEQRHRERPIAETFEKLGELGYVAHSLHRDGERSIDRFDVERDQLRYLDGTLRAGRPHPDYVSDFIFRPAATSS